MSDQILSFQGKAARAFLLLVIAAGFVIAAGCVGNGTAPGSGTAPAAVTGTAVVTTPAAEPSPVTAPAAAPAGLRVITEDLPPFSYACPDGKATGQATDVVVEILARLNQTAEIEVLPWSEGYQAALDGPMVALYSTGRNDEREHLFRWAGPVTSFEYTFYARNGSGIAIASLDEAKTAGTVGVEKDDVRHQYLQQQNFTRVVTCGTDADCLNGLLENRTDLWLSSGITLPAMLAQEGVDPAAITEVYTVQSGEAYIAFSPDTPESVVAAWQDTLDEMKRDGTFTALRLKYNLSAES
jgi:polar amino acid transport system substrate-binding protein